jgi:hypothetical protein
VTIDRDILRWGLLIGATPIWWPFLRALWRDFNAALRDEGGLFGREPSAKEMEEARRTGTNEHDTLVSEPWVRPGEHRAPRLRTPGARPGPPRSAKPGAGFRGNDKPRGFR